MTANRPDPMVRAQQHSDRYDTARKLLHKQLDALGVLFGQPVREVIYRPFEELVEHAGEMLYNYSDEIRAKQDRIAELGRQVYDARMEKAELGRHARRCATELQARYKRSKVNQPDWLIEALQAAGPGPLELAEEPF